VRSLLGREQVGVGLDGPGQDVLRRRLTSKVVKVEVGSGAGVEGVGA